MRPELESIDQQLAKVLAATRTGDYTNAQIALDNQLKVWAREQQYPSEDQDADYLLLRYATLNAEVADHYGFTVLADEALAHLRESILQDVRSPSSANTGSHWRLERQKLLLSWQIAVNRYRHGGNRLDVKRQLQQTRIRAENLRPVSDGLLTQLYYAEAKLHLRGSAFAEAITMYRQCLVKASARFANPYAETVPLGEAAHDERAALIRTEKDAARYTVAKILAFGLGRTFFEQGRLEEARALVVAGELLLEATHDVSYRYHAKLLLGAIERDAATADDHATLASARARFGECLAYFGAERSYMLLRTEYEFGLLELRQGNFAEARKLIESAQESATKKGRTRWMTSAKIALSRIARKCKDYGEAVQLAEDAVHMGYQYNLPRAVAEAQSALASAIYDQAIALHDRQLFTKAEEVLVELLSTCDRRDARARVMPYLLLAKIRYACNETKRAQESYEEYERIGTDVQIARVNEFAEFIRRQIYL